MKGIIFNIAERFITETYGEEKFNEIMAACKLETKELFVGPGTYPDADLIQIVVKSAANLGVSIQDFLERFGHFTFMQLAAGFPQFVTPYTHPRPFLKTIENVVHVEVKKMYDHSKPPTFIYTDKPDGSLTITYYSERKLYDLMTGLINGVADHFKNPITQKKHIYLKDGLEVCDFELSFAHPEQQ